MRLLKWDYESLLCKGEFFYPESDVASSLSWAFSHGLVLKWWIMISPCYSLVLFHPVPSTSPFISKTLFADRSCCFVSFCLSNYFVKVLLPLSTMSSLLSLSCDSGGLIILLWYDLLFKQSDAWRPWRDRKVFKIGWDPWHIKILFSSEVSLSFGVTVVAW